MDIESHQQARLTRRALLGGTARLAAAGVMAAHSPALFSETRPEDSQSAIPGSGIWRRRAQIFTLDRVSLGSGPFRDAMERDRLYLLSLEPDRFLHYYRTSAGLQPKADPYGGWERNVGRMLGHYLSACSMYARSTSDPAFLQRRDYIVGELAECQRANGNGYVGGIADAKRLFTEIGHGNIYLVKHGQGVTLNGVHAPWYMLHKMAAGLRDAYIYGDNDQALAVLSGFSDWASTLTDSLSEADQQKMIEVECGGINEVFADMYAYTGREKYLVLSRRFNRASVMSPLMQRMDLLTGLHANTQIPAVLGLYRQYEVSGDQAARRGSTFFWETVTKNRSYVIGGDSDQEHFYALGTMGNHLSVATAETCNSYNMVKLTDRLFAGAPAEALAAYSERVLWNDILASLDHRSPGMTYFMSLKPGHFKTFSTPYDSFWCCVGTGMENHVKYGESLYFHSADQLWINQFIASELDWPEQEMRIVQSTTFPHEERSEWRIHCRRPVKATLSLRHPEWAGEGFSVQVNGRAADRSRPGSYLPIRRTWRNGDIIAAVLPMSIRLHPMPDDPAYKTVMYGPIVLAGLLGREGMPPTAPYAGNNQLLYKSVADPVAPSLGTGGDLSASFQKVSSLQFSGKVSDGSRIRFVPLASITQDRYSVYWKTV